MMIFMLMTMLYISAITMLVSRDSKATLPDIAIVPITAGYASEFASRSTGWGGPGLRQLGDGLYDLMNTPAPVYDNLAVTAVTNQFSTFDIFGYTDPPPVNSTVLEVKITVIGKMNGKFNHGWLSWAMLNGTSWYNSHASTWMNTTMEPYNSASVGITSTTGNTIGLWHLSPEFPWNVDGSYGLIGAPGITQGINYWDVTDDYPWNVTNLMSNQLTVMWTTNRNTTANYVDYLGLTYTVTNYFAEPAYDLPLITAGVNITGLIWLLIIFLPAIVMNQVIPKLGFATGLILMLLVIGITQTGFLYVTVIGIVSVAVSLYKKETNNVGIP
jgi:hypothetical protein